MKMRLKFLFAGLGALLAFGCATAPDVVYITDAQEVTSQALEPVNLDPSALKNDITKKFTRQLPPEMVDVIMSTVNEQIARTKRFTKVIENAIDGENYIIVPGIDSLNYFETPIPTDPTRKKVTFKARVRLDVKFMNQKGQVEQVKSYSDLRTLEKKVSVKDPMTDAKRVEYYNEVIEVGFKAAANLLGVAFNPSYEMGRISKLNGRVAHIQINTSKIRKMPKKSQAVEVVDERDNNKVLATIAGLTVEDGSITGTVYEKSGASVKEGSKVRARVNGLSD